MVQETANQQDHLHNMIYLAPSVMSIGEIQKQAHAAMNQVKYCAQYQFQNTSQTLSEADGSTTPTALQHWRLESKYSALTQRSLILSDAAIIDA